MRAAPEPLVHRNEYELIGEPLSSGGDTDTSAPDALTDTDGAPGDDGLATVVSEKLAVTERSADSVTAHEPVPAHAPPQPVKLDPAAATADRVTEAPPGHVVEHTCGWAAAPHCTAAGELVTVPAP